MKTFEEFDNSMSPQEVIDYITEITPEESDVPDYFFTMIKRSGKRFIRKVVNIDDVLEKDPSAKEYVDSGEERYGEDIESDYEPYQEELDNPIVIFNDEVMDGYSRLAELKKLGDKTITAYVA